MGRARIARAFVVFHIPNVLELVPNCVECRILRLFLASYLAKDILLLKFIAACLSQEITEAFIIPDLFFNPLGPESILN